MVGYSETSQPSGDPYEHSKFPQNGVSGNNGIEVADNPILRER
jgi:hypothetical protein